MKAIAVEMFMKVIATLYLKKYIWNQSHIPGDKS